MVWAVAGFGVCMAANGGAAVTSGTLMGLLSGPWVPARRNGRRTRGVYLLEGLFPGRAAP